jgi:hypothetical protein
MKIQEWMLHPQHLTICQNRIFWNEQRRHLRKSYVFVTQSHLVLSLCQKPENEPAKCYLLVQTEQKIWFCLLLFDSAPLHPLPHAMTTIQDTHSTGQKTVRSIEYAHI